MGSSSSRCDSPTGRKAVLTFSVGTSWVDLDLEAERLVGLHRLAPGLGTAMPRWSILSELHAQPHPREDLVGGGEGIESRARPGAPRRARSPPRSSTSRLQRAASGAARSASSSCRRRLRAPLAREQRPRPPPRAEALDRGQQRRRCPGPRWPPSARSRADGRRGRASESIDSISATTRSTPSRSALFTTNTSAISMIPALRACTSSPRPGTSTTSSRRRCPTISTSSCPTPTVSTRITSLPEAASTVSTWPVAAARPPRWPRVAIERMNTPGSRAWACMRMRSPRIAPPLKGEVGSTATIPTRLALRAQVRGQPVDERRLAGARRAGDADDQRAAGVREEGAPGALAASGRSSSTRLIARATARTSPAQHAGDEGAPAWPRRGRAPLAHHRAAGGAARGR